MNIDIQTEHVALLPAWKETIAAWVVLCRQRHPAVGALDVTFRHADQRQSAEQVDAVATAGPRTHTTHATAEVMSVALDTALETLERELSRDTPPELPSDEVSPGAKPSRARRRTP